MSDEPTDDERRRAEEVILEQPDLGTGYCDLTTMLVSHARKELAAASATIRGLREACKLAKKHLEPDLVEPGRTVFWKLVDVLRATEPDTTGDKGNDREIAGLMESIASQAEQIAELREERDKLRQGLKDIVCHGITLPITTEQNMTEGELRWYARGVDSQRAIAGAALLAPTEPDTTGDGPR